MLQSDANLEEIAFESGFPNKKSFIQQFKATYQLTPHQYRLMRRKEGREG
ncbi:AraC family transcriptional regulator [Ohessyouella blattaphilus]